MKNEATGIKRVINATKFSAMGLKTAIIQEASFRQEVILSLIMLPNLFWLQGPAFIKWLIFMAHILVMVTELLNSAMETVVDMVSPDYHHLAKQAKDIGSAAVFIALIPTTVLWGYILYSHFIL